MTARTLDVYCFGRRAGTLTDAPGALEFAYAPEWQAKGPPLSQSLPLDGSFAPEAVAAFFGGLLPEGQPRQHLERTLGVSRGNAFAMLAALGGDTAGAISVFAADVMPPPEAGDDDVEWLDDDGVAQLVDQLPSRPMHADGDGEWRLSLAGAQDKLPVVVNEDGGIGLTRGRTPSTHILKTPIERLPDTVANEAFSLRLAGVLGLDVVTAVPRRIGGRELLLVERYDRERGSAGHRLRLHQEDFCQALGVPSERKYEAEGGPGLGDCFDLIRRAVWLPAPSMIAMLDLVTLNFVLGNHDAHGKNVSLLYAPGTARATLAPAYDLLSTIAYDSSHRMSRKMAMRIGGEYRPDYVRGRHLDRMLERGGLGKALGRRRMRRVAEAAPAAASALRAAFVAEGWDAGVLGEIEAVIGRRSQQLIDITASASS